MAVSVQVSKELESHSSSKLEELKREFQEKLSLAIREEQDLSNSLEALRQGEGDPLNASKIYSRAQELQVNKLSINIRLAELEIARLSALTRESEEEMKKFQEEIDKAEDIFRKAEEELKAAKAPYWTLHNMRSSWAQSRIDFARRRAELQSQRLQLINKHLGSPLPPPEKSFLEALGSGVMKAPEDV